MLKVVQDEGSSTRRRARCSTRSCGTTQDQLTHKHAPFELTLAGLLYHLALVEEDWMEVRFAGLPEREPRGSVDWDTDPDWEFRTARDLQTGRIAATVWRSLSAQPPGPAQAAGLEHLLVRPLRDGQRFSLRWVLLHLTEETARYAGHADFLREAIDGRVGE